MITLHNVYNDDFTLGVNKNNLIDCLFDFYFNKENVYFFYSLKSKIEKIKGKRELQSFINKLISLFVEGD